MQGSNGRISRQRYFPGFPGLARLETLMHEPVVPDHVAVEQIAIALQDLLDCRLLLWASPIRLYGNDTEGAALQVQALKHLQLGCEPAHDGQQRELGGGVSGAVRANTGWTIASRPPCTSQQLATAALSLTSLYIEGEEVDVLDVVLGEYVSKWAARYRGQLRFVDGLVPLELEGLAHQLPDASDS